jgi:hypothetical protein
MATKRVPILGLATVPDSTNDCLLGRYDSYGSNDVWKHLVLVFGASNAAAPTVRAGVYGRFAVPKDYVSTAKIIVVWTATLTSGDVVFDFDYRTVGGNDTTSLDQSGTEESVSVTDTAPGAAHRRLEAELNPTDANFTADDEVEFYLVRDGTDGADTMAGSALVFAAFFEYTD